MFLWWGPELVQIFNAGYLPSFGGGGRDIVREYCQHCYFVGSARAKAAGLVMRLAGGNGSCRHTFAFPTTALPPQVMHDIAEARG